MNVVVDKMYLNSLTMIGSSTAIFQCFISNKL